MRFWLGFCASHQRSSGYQFVFEFPTLPIWMATEVISLSSLLDHSCSAIVRGYVFVDSDARIGQNHGTMFRLR